MNIEKQTYLNTEQMQSFFERQGKAVACYGAGSRYGGVRFRLRAKTKVTLHTEFHSIAERAKISLDGMIMTDTLNKISRFEFTLAQGEHLFDVDCASHGGFVLTVEAAGLEEGARYFDRIGGHSAGGETVLYFSHGDRDATSLRRTNGTEESAVLSSHDYDDTLLYDKTNQAYTATTAYITTINNRKRVLIYLNRNLYFNCDKVESVAICDGRTLETGADYIAMYVYDGGNMKVLRANHNTRLDTSAVLSWSTPVLRVASAQNGSVLMVQTPDYVWTAFYFHENGGKEMNFTRHTFHYDEIPLCRNRYVAPTATVDADGGPIFYYKKEDGRLMCMAYGEDPVEIGYYEAYHPGTEGGYLQYAGEVQYQAAE